MCIALTFPGGDRNHVNPSLLYRAKAWLHVVTRTTYGSSMGARCGALSPFGVVIHIFNYNICMRRVMRSERRFLSVCQNSTQPFYNCCSAHTLFLDFIYGPVLAVDPASCTWSGLSV